MTKKILCALIVGLSVATSFATPDPRLAEGIALHDAAMKDSSKIEKGKEVLEPLIETSSVAKGYYGSLVTLEAGVYADKKNVIKAMSLLNKGSALIDAAVDSDPDNEDLRFLRMENAYEVSESSPLNRYKVMKKDLDWLDSRKASYDKAWQGVIELYKGMYLVKSKKIDEALDAFDACIAVSPGSPEAARAESEIDRYSE
jgi:tetratricopeptide (TPR) repeat protein